MQAALGDETTWTRIGLRQLSGMLIMVFARSHMQARPHSSLESEICNLSSCGVLYAVLEYALSGERECCSP